MNMLNCNVKSANSIVMLFFIIIGIYVALNLLYVMTTSSVQMGQTGRPGVFPAGVLVGDGANALLPVQISDIKPNDNGNVDLVLSLNMKDLVAMLNKMSNPEGADQATDHFIPGNISITLHNPNLCKGRKLDWVVYVHSSPGNKEKRENLRTTWGNIKLFKNRNFIIVFLVGAQSDEAIQKELQAEFATYGDIVQGNFVDHYRNLTLKGIMGLEWISSYCAQAPFVIKADDDAFVNIFELLKVLGRAKDIKKTIACPLWKDNSMPILRDPAKCMKWCVKFNEFPGQKHFPKYCAGLTYVMGMDTVKGMHEAAHKTPFFWIDDVYITGLLPAKIKGVEYVDFLKNFTLKQPLAIAQYANVSQPITYILAHIKKISDFKEMWSNLLHRLPRPELEMISEEVIDSFPKLRTKLTGSS